MSDRVFVYLGGKKVLSGVSYTREEMVANARNLPASDLYCPFHPDELWFSEGPAAPKRCCDCERLLVPRPEVA